MGFIKRSWRGEEKLWKVFWLYGILLSFAIGIVFGIIGTVVMRMHATPVLWLLGLIFLLYTVWWFVSVWTCSKNVRVKFWCYAARVYVVLAVVSVFLQIPAALLVGQDLVKAAECRKVLTARAQAAGVSFQQYRESHQEEVTQCARDGAQNMGLTPAVTAVPAAAAPAPTVNSQTAAYQQTCETRMTNYAIQYKADPKTYIATNQAYLQQCIQQLSKQAAGAK